MGHSIAINYPNIVFIGGSGRSGTNISKALLAQHPQVASLPFEYRFIIDPDGIVDYYNSYTAAWSPYMADRRLKKLEHLLTNLAHQPKQHYLIGKFLSFITGKRRTFAPCYQGWNLNQHLPNFQHHVDDLMKELCEFSFSARWVGTEGYTFSPQLYFAKPKEKKELAIIFGSFIARAINDFLLKQQKKLFVEDNTWNILFARELLELIPTAKILHVFRDPRDVVSSFTQQSWSPSTPDQAALWYKSIMEHWFTVKQYLPQNSYHEYSLEQLSSLPQQTVYEICSFIDIPYEPNLLTIDLTKTNSGRWKHQFTAEEQKEIEFILGDIIEALGYK